MRSDHWRDEVEFVPRNLEELKELRQRIIDAGHPNQVANGVVGWLLDKTEDVDVTGAPTRSRYRKILAELEPPARTPEPDDGGRRLRAVPSGDAAGVGRRSRGSAAGRAVAAVALAGLASLGIGAVEGRQAQASVPVRAGTTLGAESGYLTEPTLQAAEGRL